MKTRILSACILVPFLALLYFGGYVLMAGCIFVGVVGLHEFYKGFRAMDIHPSYPLGVISLALLYGIYIGMKEGLVAQEKEASIYLLWLFITVLMALLSLFKMEKRKPQDALATITGVVYVVFFSFHVLLVQQSDAYGLLVWLVILGAFGTEIFAYFAVVFLGKHRLCPTISPKKTIEGSLGGILGSVVLCTLFGRFFAPDYWVHCLIIGLLCGMISQLGDLTASIFKRHMGIKDYGNLIPGHGGILDRFDSVLFTAPLVYYYIVLVLA